MNTNSNNLTSNLQVKINRLQARRAALIHKLSHADRSQRKARTRHLIQLGGLLNMINLPERCGLSEGEDLQLDFEASDKAAVLLGMLIHLNDSLPDTLSVNQLEQFKQKGVRFLKNQTTQESRIINRSIK